jgi:hypothetical protein
LAQDEYIDNKDDDFSDDDDNKDDDFNDDDDDDDDDDDNDGDDGDEATESGSRDVPPFNLKSDEAGAGKTVDTTDEKAADVPATPEATVRGLGRSVSVAWEDLDRVETLEEYEDESKPVADAEDPSSPTTDPPGPTAAGSAPGGTFRRRPSINGDDEGPILKNFLRS